MSAASVPKLRFPEFDGVWSQGSLDVIANISDGTHQTPNYVKDGIPFYSVEHVTANQFVETKFIEPDVFAKEKPWRIPARGDVLMTRIGDIGTARHIDWDIHASIYVSLALFKPKKGTDGRFLSDSINSEIMQKRLYARTIHVAFPKKINLGDLGKVVAIYPTLEEQKKIGNFLSAVDDKIIAQKTRLESWTHFKHGMMQALFSRKLRFNKDDGGGFPEWETVRLEKIAKVTMGQSPDSSSYNTDEVGLPLVQGNADFDRNGIIASRFTSSPIRIAEIGSTIMSVRAPVGETGFIDKKICLGRGVAALTANPKSSARFLKHLIVHSELRWRRIEQGSTFKAVSGEDIRGLKVPLPSLPEQQKIANALSAIDAKIEALSDSLEATREFKRGLLQKMFV